jgi:hypothetical protein
LIQRPLIYLWYRCPATDEGKHRTNGETFDAEKEKCSETNPLQAQFVYHKSESEAMIGPIIRNTAPIDVKAYVHDSKER